jgi:Flp pilus assembly pilin Flp
MMELLSHHEEPFMICTQRPVSVSAPALGQPVFSNPDSASHTFVLVGRADQSVRLAAVNHSPRPRVTQAVAPRLRVLARQAGQGMTEYLIVVALIAVAAIGVYSLLGQTLRSQTAGLALEVSGQDAGATIGAARAQAGAAQAGAATRKGLDNFNDGNR